MKPLLLGLPFLAAALLSLGLTPLAKKLAARLGAMDHPNERKVHKTPIPRLGGVAVVGAFAIVCSAVLWGLIPVPRALQPSVVNGLCLGLLPVFLVSLLDDVKPQRALTRLAAQSLGAVIVMASGFVLNPAVHLFGEQIHLGLLAWPLSFLWIVGITNAFNLIDGLDGLSAGLAFISSVSLAGVFLLAGRIDVAVIPLALAGALLGFLRYNLHPASVFLGDSGACTVGFVLACLCLKGGALLSAGLAVLVPVLIVGVPLADTLLSILRRVLGRFAKASGRGVMDADRSHIHHKLLGLGITQRRAVLVLYGSALVGVAVAFGSLFLSASGSALFLLALLGAAVVGISRLGYDELAFIRNGSVLKLYDLPALKTGFFVVFADLLMAVAALYLSLGLKWDDWGLVEHRGLALELGAAVPVLVFATFHLFGLYKGRWRHATIEDFIRPTWAVLLTGLGALVLDRFTIGAATPLSFFVLFTLVLLLLVNASRSSYRLLAWWRAKASVPGVPVLLYGAGRRGSMAIRELTAYADAPLRPVGFVDDDPDKAGVTLNGVPVVGTSWQIEELLETHGAKGVVVTSPKIPAELVDRVEEACAVAGVSFLHFNVSFEGTLLASRTGDTSTRAARTFVETFDATVAPPAPER
ncbi:MAG: hypothetical protein KJ062_06890 [Thermoanaerobaculia bacterium]|nr:hypothetical protein [Thermoanaerobaculia bacterium]